MYSQRITEFPNSNRNNKCPQKNGSTKKLKNDAREREREKENVEDMFGMHRIKKITDAEHISILISSLSLQVFHIHFILQKQYMHIWY